MRERRTDDALVANADLREQARNCLDADNMAENNWGPVLQGLKATAEK